MPEKHRRRARLTRLGPRRAGAPATIRYRVARTSDVAPGESLKFVLPILGNDEECFMVNFRGQFHAYVNRCRHLPLPMNWIDERFFAEEGRYLTCRAHNAYYEPATGRCVAGPAPACGKFLYRVPLEIINGAIYTRPPEGGFDPD
jgi:nitrite reductase/ring-hydroxylating ferredoxin subunit